MNKDIKNSCEIFLYIYSIICNEISTIINYNDSKNIEEININNIINIIDLRISLEYKENFKTYYQNIYFSLFKNYDDFINHYIENTLFIYVLQNNKINIYKSMLKDYFENVVESTNGFINKNSTHKNHNIFSNIFSNIKFYFHIYKIIISLKNDNLLEDVENKVDLNQNLNQLLKDINANNIGNTFTSNFYILSIIYIFSNKIEYLDIIINYILKKNFMIEIIKLVNNMVDIIVYTVNNNQIENYEYILAKYFEIIKKYQNNSLINMDYHKSKYQLKKMIFNINHNISKKLNILSYFKIILSYFTKEEICNFCTNDEIKNIIHIYKDINVIFGYLDLIGYDKYNFHKNNYKNKFDILIYLSVYIDYKDGVYIYEQINTKDKNKYFISYLTEKTGEILNLYKNHKKNRYIENIINYILQNDMDYINKFLDNIKSKPNKFDNYKEYFIGIQQLIIHPFLFNLLNDESHIKLLTITLSKYKEKNIDANEKILINTYINNIISNNYIFTNIDVNIDTKNTFIEIMYETNKDLLLYVLKTLLDKNELSSKIIIKLCDDCIKNNDMDFFEKIFIFLNKLNIDLYDGIILHIHNDNFINYCKNNEYIQNNMKKYINYKKEYLINIDEKIKKLNNFKCKCFYCNSFFLNKINNYKDADNYNPIFYYCIDCNMNLHDQCLYEVIPNHRGKIKKCEFCESKNIQCIKLSTAEYKYIIYHKLLNNYDFSIHSLE